MSPDQARFVGRMMNRRIFVVHPDGGMRGYDVIPDGDGAFIQPPFAFGGAKVATDDDVRFVEPHWMSRKHRTRVHFELDQLRRS